MPSANPQGTPAEQARAAAGWLTGGAANHGRRIGAIGYSHTCSLCAHLTLRDGGWRCGRPDATPVTGWATELEGWCEHWQLMGLKVSHA